YLPCLRRDWDLPYIGRFALTCGDEDLVGLGDPITHCPLTHSVTCEQWPQAGPDGLTAIDRDDPAVGAPFGVAIHQYVLTIRRPRGHDHIYVRRRWLGLSARRGDEEQAAPRIRIIQFRATRKYVGDPVSIR